MKKSRINPVSKKRKVQLKDELIIRSQLCERAGGEFHSHGGESVCLGGLCELCKNPPDWRGLHPHEQTFRSQGGKLSMENSKMVCGKCSNKEHHINEVASEPMWSKEV